MSEGRHLPHCAIEYGYDACTCALAPPPCLICLEAGCEGGCI